MGEEKLLFKESKNERIWYSLQLINIVDKLVELLQHGENIQVFLLSVRYLHQTYF